MVIATDNDDGPLWVAALDRRSPAQRIPGVHGSHPVFGADGEIFFNMTEGAKRFAYRARMDGSGLRRLFDRPVAAVRGITPDHQWVIVRVPDDRGTALLAVPVGRGDPIYVAAASTIDSVDTAQLRWSANGGQLFVSFATTAYYSASVGATYIVPLPPGQMFPDIPAGGFKSKAEIGAMPGTERINMLDVAAGPAPGIYAFARTNTQRNLFRIPLR
jgi:hypothetical protein